MDQFFSSQLDKRGTEKFLNLCKRTYISLDWACFTLKSSQKFSKHLKTGWNRLSTIPLRMKTILKRSQNTLMASTWSLFNMKLACNRLHLACFHLQSACVRLWSARICLQSACICLQSACICLQSACFHLQLACICLQSACCNPITDENKPNASRLQACCNIYFFQFQSVYSVPSREERFWEWKCFNFLKTSFGAICLF